MTGEEMKHKVVISLKDEFTDLEDAVIEEKDLQAMVTTKPQ